MEERGVVEPGEPRGTGEYEGFHYGGGDGNGRTVKGMKGSLVAVVEGGGKVDFWGGG